MTLSDYIDTLREKRVCVIGLGVSNTPLIELLLQSGVSVTVCDKRSAPEIGICAEKIASMGAALRLGEDYPLPVVDHARARERTLMRFAFLAESDAS